MHIGVKLPGVNQAPIGIQKAPAQANAPGVSSVVDQPVGDQTNVDFSSTPTKAKITATGIDMLARMMMSGIANMPILPGPVGALGPVITGQRSNWESGVLATDKLSVGGKSTEFSLPGHTNVTVLDSPLGGPQFVRASTLEIVDRDTQPRVQERSLKARLLPDKSVEITNLNGTLTLLNPDDLSLR